MKKTLPILLPAKRGLFLLVIALLPFLVTAQDNWPKEIKSAKSTIIVYQPQSDSMAGDHLYTRSAISITLPGSANPVFGAVWADSKFSTDRETGTGTIYNVKVLNVRFPGIDTIDALKVKGYKDLLSEEATAWNLDFSIDEMKSSLALNKSAAGQSAGFKNDPPEIIFVKQKSVLVVFDGDPVLTEVENAGLKRVINTPFLVLFDKGDKNYYLNGGDYWYRSADPVKSAWANVAKPSAAVSTYYSAMMEQAKKSGTTVPPQATKSGDNVVPKIVVRTKPAELIQSKGEPSWAPIQGTQLLYMTNSDDNIFMTTDKNSWFVLISGRWYSSMAITGPWSYVESDKLPADFAKIPEGSEKDVVLASVAGTDASKEAIMDAQIPQTAAVDRKTAKCEVKYDGDPKFEKISGTDLARAMNTSSTVLLYTNVYYVCDNAVWFTGNGPVGPWVVATSVPSEIQKIPPGDPSYNVKYVYIYDVQPDVVFVGYTPGYTGCYIYGPTVVYGTGFYYPPFYGPYYYPRPVTYGFSMHYNPWCGWSMGFSMSMGMFTFSMGGYHGGWWGPPMYRPPYHPPYNHYYGSRPPAYRGGGNTINIDNSRNIYTNRGDRSTRPSQQPVVSGRPSTGDRNTGSRPSTRPAGGDAGNRQNNVFTDRNGDVYRNNNGDWQKNNGRDWQSMQQGQQGGRAQEKGTKTAPSVQDRSAQPSTRENGGGFDRKEMDRQNSARQRGNQNMNNRSSMQRPSGGGGGGARSGGGGRRR